MTIKHKVRRREVFPEQYENPLKLDHIDVTNLLMNAAQHIGVDYGVEHISPIDEFDAELRIHLARESPFYDGKMNACHLLDSLASFHQWIRPQELDA